MKQRLTTAQYMLIGTLVITGAFLFGGDVLAKVGVGMGAGEIRVTEDIKPGGIYSLPSLRVFNTGDETATYGMNVAYHQDNPQIRPAKSWFTFEPPTFTLEAGQSQEVFITMTVPVNAEPGDYFSFLESGPIQTQTEGTSVGVAVATKLFFTIVPANFYQAVVYRVTAFMHSYAPWTWVGFGVVLLGGLVFTLRRFFSFSISLKKKEGS